MDFHRKKKKRNRERKSFVGTLTTGSIHVVLHLDCLDLDLEENKGKKGKLKEKDRDDDDDRVTAATGDDLVILRDFESIIDSGTTLHVTPRKEFFTSYTLGDFEVLKMGNDSVTKGIIHEKIPPKTPQLNGLAKRMNRTLIERVRCMLSEAKLPKHFWGETLYTTVHVINLSPTIALNTEVPDKIWFGKDVKYDHLRVFGCKAFVHVPKDERSKLDMKTRQCIFIEYGHDEYGYMLYDLVEKKLVKSRDVQFMEDQTIKDIDKVKKATPKKDNSLSEIDPVRMFVHDLDTIDNNLGHDFDNPLDDDAKEEQEMSQDKNPGDATSSSTQEV
ncbi:hypothetical protein CR513_18044, partial [Mucuna pruriens]